jgi:hypothetical protein
MRFLLIAPVAAAAALFVASSGTAAAARGAPDPGPTYGRDFAGGDYNVTEWHSDPSKSANHWQAAALECEALCVADPQCCTWTYCTPEAGSGDPERCCLKNSIPAEVAANTHWTGAPKGATPECLRPPPPPYPGPSFLAPAVTNRPPCVQVPNWHDVAGALVGDDGRWHVFQGTGECEGTPAGWHHAVSTNLVDWDNLGIEPSLSALAEPYGTSSPCSGFMVRDDDGLPCAGFRECSGAWPGRTNTQVPLELRCALDANGAAELNNFSSPEYVFWFYFNRNLPYDPVRPWKDSDGRWYAVISADACNSTVPCAGGGALYLYSSPRLRGAGADWKPSAATPIMFASNWTVLTPFDPMAVESNEFVTVRPFRERARKRARKRAQKCDARNSPSLVAPPPSQTLVRRSRATSETSRAIPEVARRAALLTMSSTPASAARRPSSAARRCRAVRSLWTRQAPSRAV